MAEIRQIEVVKGPNSALFGFNAAAGVINIVTYNPLYDKVNSATIQGGTQGYGQASAVGTAKLGDRVAVRLSAGGTRTDEFSALSAIARSRGLSEQGRRGSVSADGYVQLTDTPQLELEATHVGLQHLEELAIWTPAYASYNLNSLKAHYTASTPVGLVEALAYTNFFAGETHFPAGNADPWAVKCSTKYTVAQVQDSFSAGPDHTFRIAAEFRNAGTDTSPATGGHVGYNVASASGMWSWRIAPRLSLTEAVRLDALWLGRSGSFAPGAGFTNADWNRTIVQPAFNVGAVWQATDEDTLRLTVARGPSCRA